MRDLARPPRAAGFPEHHRPMSSLPAVPIQGEGSYRGAQVVAYALRYRLVEPPVE